MLQLGAGRRVYVESLRTSPQFCWEDKFTLKILNLALFKMLLLKNLLSSFSLVIDLTGHRPFALFLTVEANLGACRHPL